MLSLRVPPHLFKRRKTLIKLTLLSALLLTAVTASPFVTRAAKKRQPESMLPVGHAMPETALRATSTQAMPNSTVAFAVRTIQLPANDLVYSPINGKLYASVPSENLTTLIQDPVTQIVSVAPDTIGGRGNTITEIDPASVTLGRSVWVGSEPGDLALADDNRSLYVYLSGSRSVRRFDLLTMTTGLQFWLGPVNILGGGDENSAPPGGGIFTEIDMRVLPGLPDSLMLSRGSGVAIYDNGVERPGTTDEIGQGKMVVTPDDWPATAYATDDRGTFYKYGILQSGIYNFVKYPYQDLLLAPTVDMKFAGGRIYTSNGQIIDPQSPTPKVLGTFPGFWPAPRPTFSSMIVDQSNGLVYYLYSAFGGDDKGPYSDAVSVRAYDQRSLALVGSFDIHNVVGRPKGFTRWGGNGLAFCAGNNIYVIRTSLIPSSDPLDLPAPSPTPTPTPTTVSAVIRQIQLSNNDIVSDRRRGRIYASVPADSPGYANSIAVIDPAAAAVTSSIPAGVDPAKLSLTDDGQYLYAGLNGEQAVRRIDLVSGVADIKFPLVQDSATTPHDIYTLDMESPPGNPHRVVVSRMYLFPGSFGMTAGTRIYDDGVQWGMFGAGGDTFAFADATTLYGMGLFGSGAIPSGKSVIRPDGVTNTLLPDSYFGGDFKIDHGLIFTPIGRIADPSNVKYVGTNTVPGLYTSPEASVVEPDVNAGRAYYLSGFDSINGSPTTWKIFAFDLSTNLVVATIEVPGVKGMASPLVRWGDHGLAFGTGGGQIFLVESPAILSAAPPTIQFASTNVTVGEGEGRATVSVVRAGGTTGAVSVNYATSDSTASAGSDYTATSGTLNFADGEASKTFDVPVMNDALNENSETINLTLSDTAGGAALGSPVKSTITIKDDDPKPHISVGDASVLEGNSGTTNAVFTVTLSPASGRAVTCLYTTVDGTATANSDYSPVAGMLTFNPGETSKQMVVAVKGDTAVEPDETFNFNLTDSPNAIVSRWQGIGTIKNDDTATVAPTVQFASATFNTSETGNSSAPRATITVTRTGDTSGSSSVSYRTVDDPAAVRCDVANATAYARCDYTSVAGTILFNAGETQKGFSVPIIDDAFVEGTETFSVALSNPTGATLGSVSTASVSISDNDQSATANPLDTTEFFVRQQYLDFLSREPDPEGFAAWVNTINRCAAGDQTCDRVSVSANFFRSQEFQLKGLFVFRFYKVAFGRMPLYSEIVADMAAVTGDSTPDLIARKAAFTEAFAQRQEFVTAFGAAGNQLFVDTLMNRYSLQQITTINPSSPDDTSAPRITLTRTDLVSRLNAATMTRGQVVRAVADSNEVSQAEFNPAFVAMQYFGYLRRDPDQGGYNDWLRTINANPSDVRSMVNGFVNSIEYRLRFGQP